MTNPKLREKARLALMDWLNRKTESREFEDRNMSDFEAGYLKALEEYEKRVAVVEGQMPDSNGEE
jgi:hypothetical protein